MQSIRPTVPRARQTSGQLGGMFLLLVYLVTTTPLAPAVVALLARFDRGHQVALQQSAQGLQVVLRHGCLNPPSHRHGMVARALTVFAQRPIARQSDHVIQFGATNTAQQTPALTIAPASNSPASDGNVPCDFVFHPTGVTLDLPASPRSPPAVSGLLLAIRTTVLRI